MKVEIPRSLVKREVPEGWDNESIRESYLRYLTPRELWVIERRFGLNGDLVTNFRVLGEMMAEKFGGGSSRESVRRVERIALRKMLWKQTLRRRKYDRVE